MRSVKRLFAVIICAALTSATAVFCFADVPSRPASGHIRDASFILKADTVDELNGISSALAAKNGAAIYMLTVGSFDGKGTGDYASDAFGRWKLGERDLLVVVNTAEQDYYATAGGELSAYFSSEALKTVLASSFEPGFAAGNYDAAAVSLFNALSAEISVLELESSGGVGGFFVTLFLVILVLLIIFIAFIFVMRTINMRRARNRRRARRGNAPRRPQR